MEARFIYREGPTGLLVTTTAIKLHPENETRMFSIPLCDTPEQTRQILMAQAEERSLVVDLTPWQALQTWIACDTPPVTIPYAKALSKAIPPVAVRLRRDFVALLSLIRAHALLHRATRAYTADGTLVASLDDYAVVRELIADLVADGVDSSVSPQIRETVDAVRFLHGESEKDISQAAVAKYLKLDKGTTSRRIRAAVDRGYLKNLEDRKGHPAKLQLGEAVAPDMELLPSPESLERDCCTVAQECGSHTLPSRVPTDIKQNLFDEGDVPLSGPACHSAEDLTKTHLGDTANIVPARADVETTGWPIELQGFGVGAQGDFDQCHVCQQGTWQRYGQLPFCKRHALQALRNQGGPKTFSGSCDSGSNSEDIGNHMKGEHIS